MTADPVDGWYPIQVGEVNGWVCGDYVTEESSYSYGETKEEEQKRMEAEEAAAAEAEAEAQAAEAAAYWESICVGRYKFNRWSRLFGICPVCVCTFWYKSSTNFL